jgi:hypothetical protein
MEMGALMENVVTFRGSQAYVSLTNTIGLGAIKAALPREIVVEAEARGRARGVEETAAEILAELEEAIAA